MTWAMLNRCWKNCFSAAQGFPKYGPAAVSYLPHNYDKTLGSDCSYPSAGLCSNPEYLHRNATKKSDTEQNFTVSWMILFPSFEIDH